MKNLIQIAVAYGGILSTYYIDPRNLRCLGIFEDKLIVGDIK